MTTLLENARSTSPGADRLSGKIGFASAVLSTVFGMLYLLGLVGKIIVDGTVHSISSPAVQIITAVIGLLWNQTLLILFIAVFNKTWGNKKILAGLAILFMALVCATSSINWFVQLAVLPKITGDGLSVARGLLDVHNNTSITYAMEHLGWGFFYGFATIFLAVTMGDEKLERWIRGLLLVGGSLSLLHVFGIIISNPVLDDLGYLAWGLLLPLTTILLALRFRKK